MASIRAFSLGVAAVLAGWALVAHAAEDHRQYADAKRSECTDCHRSSGVMPNHDAFFLRDHRQLALKATKNCQDCHQPSFCSDCHRGGNIGHELDRSLSRRGEQMPETHAPGFIETHPLKAHDDPQSCARCHDSKRFCSDCHDRARAQNRAGLSITPHAPTFTGGLPDSTWVSTHRAQARRNLQSCQACHPRKQDCSNFACHPGLGGR